MFKKYVNVFCYTNRQNNGNQIVLLYFVLLLYFHQRVASRVNKEYILISVSFSNAAPNSWEAATSSVESAEHGLRPLFPPARSRPPITPFGTVEGLGALGGHWGTGRLCPKHQCREEEFWPVNPLSGGLACVSPSPGWIPQRGGFLGSSACAGSFFTYWLLPASEKCSIFLTAGRWEAWSGLGRSEAGRIVLQKDINVEVDQISTIYKRWGGLLSTI